MLIYIFIILLLAGRLTALGLSANVIYKHSQLVKRTIAPNLVAFRWRAFRVSLAIFAINIFPLTVNMTYLLDPNIQPLMQDPIGWIYSLLFMLMSLYLAYETSETYRHAENTESLTGLIKRKFNNFIGR